MYVKAEDNSTDAPMSRMLQEFKGLPGKSVRHLKDLQNQLTSFFVDDLGSTLFLSRENIQLLCLPNVPKINPIISYFGVG